MDINRWKTFLNATFKGELMVIKSVIKVKNNIFISHNSSPLLK
ncbi:hypothetical protein CU002_2491 [Enterococcus faecium]|nr:hypothetical protein [Enterococcus faecium]